MADDAALVDVSGNFPPTSPEEVKIPTLDVGTIASSEQAEPTKPITARSPAQTPRVLLSKFPPEIASVLAIFDVDGSGSIDSSELAAVARRMRDDSQTIKNYRWLAVVGVIVLIIVSAANFAVSLAAISYSKDSRVVNSSMRALDGSVVQVGAGMCDAGFVDSTPFVRAPITDC